MIILWLLSIRIKDVSFIDAFWAYGMAIMASVSLLQNEDPGPLAYTIWGLTALWGIRLGTHLLLRWRKDGMDPRYKKILGHAIETQGMSFARAALVRAWALQIPLLFMVCLPAQLGILLADTGPLPAISLVGLVIALIGIGFETIGDMQLKSFKENPANKGKVLDSGLWKYTRHPNYFGDFCTWWGIWLAATPAGWPVWAAAIGPLFLSFTLMKWSGAPLLEKSLKKNRPDYVDYIQRTSGFFPMPPKRSSNT
ncbi:DUF1295 domain-containing protein [Parasphingorhabdus sp.]|uniref:DUF1295 domain-containing protein n=1 Tax=Parasphingorhabdus sp. TaxID=2709688 RepID=UPI003000FEE3